MDCIIDNHHGVYIPQIFAQRYRDSIENIEQVVEDVIILEQGPEHEEYWQAWENVLDNAILKGTDGKEYRLYQDSDLFIVAEGEEIPEM